MEENTYVQSARIHASPKDVLSFLCGGMPLDQAAPGRRWSEARTGTSGLFLRDSADVEVTTLTEDSLTLCIDDGFNLIILAYAVTAVGAGTSTDVVQTVAALCRVGDELRPSAKLALMLRKQDTRLQRLGECLQPPRAAIGGERASNQARGFCSAPAPLTAT